MFGNPETFVIKSWFECLDFHNVFIDLRPLVCWDCGFQFDRGHVCLSACCECSVLSGRGLCDELITRPEESYWLWCVVVCDRETARMRRPWTTGGCHAKLKIIKKKIWPLHRNASAAKERFLRLHNHFMIYNLQFPSEDLNWLCLVSSHLLHFIILLFAFVGYFITLSVTQTTWHLTVEWLMNYEL